MDENNFEFNFVNCHLEVTIKRIAIKLVYDENNNYVYTTFYYAVNNIPDNNGNIENNNDSSNIQLLTQILYNNNENDIQFRFNSINFYMIYNTVLLDNLNAINLRNSIPYNLNNSLFSNETFNDNISLNYNNELPRNFGLSSILDEILLNLQNTFESENEFKGLLEDEINKISNIIIDKNDNNYNIDDQNHKLILNNICSICLEDFNNNKINKIRQLYCKHLFCNNCILKWFSINHTCPYCSINLKNLL